MTITRNRTSRLTMLGAITLTCLCSAGTGWCDETGTSKIPPQEVVVTLFIQPNSTSCEQATAVLLAKAKETAGLKVELRDVKSDRQALTDLWKLTRRHKLKQARVPTASVAQQLVVGLGTPDRFALKIDRALTIDVYTRPGCKRCKAAKEFLSDFRQRWPAVRIRLYDVMADVDARQAAEQLCQRYQVRVPSFPCIHLGGKLIVGFRQGVTDKAIEAVFSANRLPATRKPEAANVSTNAGAAKPVLANMFGFSMQSIQKNDGDPTQTISPPESEAIAPPAEEAEVPMPDTMEWIEESGSIDGENTELSSTDESEAAEAIDLPLFGRLRVSEVGMPMFTLLIGLVDGFNPCAMWILIFLLSILVNIKERKKIITIAGTFVVISGLVYFAFMAAWFSVFQLIGLLRPVQIGLGVLAMFIGLVNVKDFFAFHKGLSFSIPESAKPGLYRRVRKIVAAKQLTTALLGAAALAIVVNVVELLCTAGLPALYTEILALQDLPTWSEYGYLALYIAAYMFDDAVMVTIAVATLSNRKLQEAEGRWLKLLSGCVILLLGTTMVFWPDKLA